MATENDAIAIIPRESFRWRARVRFIESFRTRPAALSFAFQHGCNLIVERNDGSSLKFDVLQDPDGTCTSGLDLELLQTEDVLVETSSPGWTVLMFRTLWRLAKRLAALAVILYTREIVPGSHRVATDIRMYFRTVTPFLRRAAAVADTHLRKTASQVRQAARGYRREGLEVAFHHAWGKWFSTCRDIATWLVATIAGMYFREIAPRCRAAASRFWWSDFTLAFRRGWHRHSHGTVFDLAKRFGAIGTLHFHEVVLRYRHAASRYRWRDIEGIFRFAWSRGLSIGRGYYHWLASAVASLYRREIAPSLRYAARCWSDSKSDLRRQSWAVATPRHSNPSRLH